MEKRELIRRIVRTGELLFQRWISVTNEDAPMFERRHPDEIEKTRWHEAGHAAYSMAVFGPVVMDFMRVGREDNELGQVCYTLGPHYDFSCPHVRYGELVGGVAAGRVTWHKYGRPDYGAMEDTRKVWDAARRFASCEANPPLHPMCTIHELQYESRAVELVTSAVRCVDAEMTRLMPLITRLVLGAEKKRRLNSADLRRIWEEAGEVRIDHMQYFTAPGGYVPMSKD